METVMSQVVSQAIACVGVVCLRGNDVLLIRRGTAPRKGDWSIPGGRIEPGETEAAAALRELSEETGVTAKLGPKLATIPANFEGKNYMLHDYVAEWVSGEPVADDDADEAMFVPLSDIGSLGMWTKTEDIICLGAKCMADDKNTMNSRTQS